MNDKYKKYPEGHFAGMWMCICIAIFSVVGIPLSIVADNYIFVGMGPALGVAAGIAIGYSVENKYKQEGRIRPLSESEIKRKKNFITAGVVTLIIGIILFILQHLQTI
jgi:hypothetical protein